MHKHIQREKESEIKRFCPKTFIVSSNCIFCYWKIDLLCVYVSQRCNCDFDIFQCCCYCWWCCKCTNLIRMRCANCTEPNRNDSIVVLCHKCTNKQSGSMHYSSNTYTLYYIRLHPKMLPPKSNRENVIHTHKMQQLCTERRSSVSVARSVCLSIHYFFSFFVWFQADNARCHPKTIRFIDYYRCCVCVCVTYWHRSLELPFVKFI